MFANPFTPTFGGKPDFFFGRRDILLRFDEALVNRGSADRVLFVTGTRGCGKTALLEQLSGRASAAGKRTIDINSENALDTLMRHLVRHSSFTKSVSPELEVSILGSGGKVSGISSSKTTTYAREDFEVVFLEVCERAEHGMFVSIDEVQKINLDELSAICGAFQMASRKGLDVMLAVAGLPYSHELVIQHEGCTYMRRASHVPLSVFTHDEALGAFKDAFSGIRGLSLDDEALNRLVRASYGHPYLIQLLGYSLVAYLNDNAHAAKYRVSADDVEAIVPEAVRSFEARSLAPIVDALTPAERGYLEAMARQLEDDRTVRTGAIAKGLGRTTTQLSKVRQRLLNQGVIVSVGQGVLMFNMPCLCEFLLRQPDPSADAKLARAWRF